MKNPQIPVRFYKRPHSLLYDRVKHDLYHSEKNNNKKTYSNTCLKCTQLFLGVRKEIF